MNNMPPFTEEQLKKAMGVLGGLRIAVNPQTGLPQPTDVPAPHPILGLTQPTVASQTLPNAPQPTISPKTISTTTSTQTRPTEADLSQPAQLGSNLVTSQQTGLPSQFQQFGQLLGITGTPQEQTKQFRQIFGLELSPEEKQLREQALSTIQKLSQLQEQMTKAGIPSEGMLALDKLISEQQQTLQRLTPSELYRTNPNLQQVGITQGQLERVAAMQREPIARGLSDLLFSRSALGAQQQVQLQALQQQAGTLGTQFELQQALTKLIPTPRLPESLTGKLLETALIPPTTEDIKEYNLVKQQGFKGTFLDYQRQIANLKPSGAGITNQATIDNYVKLLSQGQIEIQNIPLNIRNIVVGRAGELGTQIISPTFAKAAREAQASFSSAQGQLSIISNLSNQVITAGSIAGLPVQALKSLPIARIFSPSRKIYADSVNAFLSMLTRAAGEKGVLTNIDVGRIRKALPSPYSDTIETANQKLANFRGLLESIRNGTIDAFTAQQFGIGIRVGTTGGITKGTTTENKTSSGLTYRIIP